MTQGVPLEDVRYLAGHAEPRTTGLYVLWQKWVTRTSSSEFRSKKRIIFKMNLEQAVHASLIEIIKCTLPFYGWVNDKPVQNGSGVLFRIGDRSFVLTAAHVLDFVGIHGYNYMTADVDGTSIPLQFEKIVTSPIPAGCQPKDSDMRQEDNWDIGFGELSSETAKRLERYWRFARLLEIDTGYKTPDVPFLVVGYPFDLTSSDDVARTIETELLKYVTEIHQGEIDDHDKTTEMILEFPVGNVTSGGKAVGVPDPKGLSGCGIWMIKKNGQSPDNWKPSDMRLVGIQHGWRKSRRYLMGTSIRHAMHLIQKHYPQLRPAMNLEFPA